MTDGEKLVRDLNDQVKRLEDAQAELDDAAGDREAAERRLIRFIGSAGGSIEVNGCVYSIDGRNAIRRCWPSGLKEVLLYDNDGWHEVDEPTSEDLS